MWSEVPRAVLFDMDGVLFDSEEVHEEAFRRVLNEEGHSLTKIDYENCFAGLTDREGLLQYAREKPVSFAVEVLLQKKVHLYQRFIEEGRCSMYPEALACINRFYKHVKLGLVTSASRWEMEGFLRSFDLTHYFDVTLCGDEVERGKPNPEGYLKAAASLGMSPRVCLVIEDSPSGVKAAKAAKMACVAITHTHQSAILRKAGADFLIDSLFLLTPEWIGGRSSLSPIALIGQRLWDR